MKQNKDIEKILKNAPHQNASRELKNSLLNQIPAKTGQSQGQFGVAVASRYRASRFWRYGVAAVFILGFSAGLSVFGIFDGGSAAWADVTSQVQQVDYVHFYRLEFRNGRVDSGQDGWYANGKIGMMYHDGFTSLDDGAARKVYSDLDKVVHSEESWIGNVRGMEQRGGIFQMLTQGVFEYDSDQINKQKPVHVGRDFAVYRFGPPNRNSQWIEEVTITVGRNSLLPVQMKIDLTEFEDAYDMYIFDYENRDMPAKLAKLLGVTGAADFSLARDWHGQYETQWGEKGEYAAQVSKVASGVFRIELRESFDSWAATLTVLEMKVEPTGEVTFTGSGDMWNGKGKGTIENGVIKGEFFGDEAGAFTMLQVPESESLAGKWQGEYESEWGERAYFVATAGEVSAGRYQIKIQDSFDEWAEELVVLEARETDAGQFDFKGSGLMWSGEGKGTIANAVFKGEFTGDESGTFTMKKLSNH